MGVTQDDDMHAHPMHRLACIRWSIGALEVWLVNYLIDQTFIEPAMRAVGERASVHVAFGLAVPPRQWARGRGSLPQLEGVIDDDLVVISFYQKRAILTAYRVCCWVVQQVVWAEFVTRYVRGTRS